jgi:hypothetical protein
MANRLNEYPDNVPCPLVDTAIDCGDCIENQTVTDGGLAESSMPEAYKLKREWIQICKACGYHEYS